MDRTHDRQIMSPIACHLVAHPLPARTVCLLHSRRAVSHVFATEGLTGWLGTVPLKVFPAPIAETCVVQRERCRDNRDTGRRGVEGEQARVPAPRGWLGRELLPPEREGAEATRDTLGKPSGGLDRRAAGKHSASSALQPSGHPASHRIVPRAVHCRDVSGPCGQPTGGARSQLVGAKGLTTTAGHKRGR